MFPRITRRTKVLAVVASVALTLTSCATALDGKPSIENAKNADLTVVGDSHGSFDTSVKNALSDIEDFWKTNYPKVSGGKALTPIKSGYFSVDGLAVARTGKIEGPAAKEGCLQRSSSFIVDNAAFCRLDDSIVWDRAQTHLFGKLADHYGNLMVALVFAHEFGHAISYRLGVFDSSPRTILTESQADCAAGAWVASALKKQAPHFRDVTPATVDAALEGFLDGRDSTPGTINEISHGNGFDRLSALADGIQNGVTYCFGKNYFDRTFTERPFSSQSDYAAGGNAPYADTIAPDGLVVSDLNRFWKAKAKSIGKTFAPVKVAIADHPKCGATASSEFGYCPTDNTVYFSDSVAKAAYNSLPDIQFDHSTGNATLLFNQPADFSLGTLFAIGWGMAVRHQLFQRSQDDEAALLAATCYTGAYAKDVNIATDPTRTRDLTLSPSDLDEAVSALLNVDLLDRTYGQRGSTGLDRIQGFVKGYKQGLSKC